MKDGEPISVRLPPDIIQRLDNAAQSMGLGNRTSLIKMSVSSFLDYFDQNGTAGLPLNWQEIIHQLDGRTHRYDHRKAAESRSDYGASRLSGRGKNNANEGKRETGK